MLPLLAIPIGLVGLLTGISLATGRRGLTMLPQSPIKGIVLVRWLRFTSTMARRPRNFESPRGRLGAFDMDARRLSDVGLAENPRKTIVGSETGVWAADWKKPLSKDAFLGSLPIQYEAFKRSMIQMTPAVVGFVGSEVDGCKCSLSGLLGVGHMAGVAGVASWVKSPETRKKFANTTETFQITNGIF